MRDNRWRERAFRQQQPHLKSRIANAQSRQMLIDLHISADTLINFRYLGKPKKITLNETASTFAT